MNTIPRYLQDAARAFPLTFYQSPQDQQAVSCQLCFSGTRVCLSCKPPEAPLRYQVDMLMSKKEFCNCKLGFPVFIIIDSGGIGLVGLENSGPEVSGQWASGPVAQ